MDDNLESVLLIKMYEANVGFIQTFGVNIMPVLRERVFKQIHDRVAGQFRVLDKHPELQRDVVNAVCADMYAEGLMKSFENVLAQEIRRFIAIYSHG